MFIFLIDENDEKFEIADGGCVDECIATLVTSELKLHYHTSTVDFMDKTHRKIILKPTKDSNLFEHASCVMAGEVIDLHIKKNKTTGKQTGVLQVSFGGLIGRFIVKDNQIQSSGVTELNVPNKMYLYVS